MGLLNGLGDNFPGRNLVIVTIMRKHFLSQYLGNYGQRLHHSPSTFFQAHAKGGKLPKVLGASNAEVNPPVA
jgi:hypothetical protein